MGIHIVLFLLVVCLLISQALLWRLDWFHVRSSSLPCGAKHSKLHRLLKPRTPDDCPACRHASTPSLGGGPAPVASLLSFCPSSPISAGEARAAARTWWQTLGATVPTTYTSDGSRQNHPTMDGS